MPGPGRTTAQAGCEGMDRHDHPLRMQGRKARVSGVIGAVEPIQTLFHPCGSDVAVGRDDRSVIKLHDEGRVILTPVGVNHQAAKV